jgi:hypothetical protein
MGPGRHSALGAARKRGALMASQSPRTNVAAAQRLVLSCGRGRADQLRTATDRGGTAEGGNPPRALPTNSLAPPTVSSNTLLN